MTNIKPQSGFYNIYLDYELEVGDDLHRSDHFPIILSEVNSNPNDQRSRWNLGKADWKRFETFCKERLTVDNLI